VSEQIIGWIRRGLRIPFIGCRRLPPFDCGIFMLDATQQLLDFMNSELTKLMQSNALEPRQRSGWISIMFFSSKTGRKQLAAHYRPTPPKQAMHGAQTN
jgi:hypothetical protein